MHVRAGVAWLLAEHLARMARSAARMQLELPPRDALEALAGEALAHWPVEVEGALRVVCTRGLESGNGGVTVFVTVSAIGDAFAAARHEGISVITASLGLPADLRRDAPWLLGGASTLVWLRDGTLFTVPAERTGILAGTTARWLLDHAGDLGWATGEEMVSPPALAGMDGAWLTSSVRGLAAIRQLDGAGLPTSPETTARIRTLLGYP
jgi:4-amino-4-deoxychorismate lyase